VSSVKTAQTKTHTNTCSSLSHTHTHTHTFTLSSRHDRLGITLNTEMTV